MIARRPIQSRSGRSEEILDDVLQCQSGHDDSQHASYQALGHVALQARAAVGAEEAAGAEEQAEQPVGAHGQVRTGAGGAHTLEERHARDRREERPGQRRPCHSVDRQAEDEGLWPNTINAQTAYVQQELRRLHEQIEVAALTQEEPDHA